MVYQSVLEKIKMNDKLIVIPNRPNDLDELRNAGVKAFLFPIEEYSIGYYQFTIEEINNCDCEKYLLINRILTSDEVDQLVIDLTKYINIKGLYFEDLGVYEILKQSDYELINWQTHFGTNYHGINYMLNQGITSYVIPNDLTYDEIDEIVNQVVKPIILFIFGKNEIMYSRRKLLSNYREFYGIEEDIDTITEKISGVKFNIKENNSGTYLFDTHYYNGTDLLKINQNIKNYLINAQDIDVKIIIELIRLIDNNEIVKVKELDSMINDGFLYKETTYRVKGDK